MKKTKRLLLALSLLILCPIPAFSVPEHAISASELRQLPPFCVGLSIANYQEDAKPLRRDIFVPGEHTHHFCHGMKALLRQEYGTAINEFDYVQSNSSPKNELLDSTSLYKAEALNKLGKNAPAIQEYTKAIQLNNKYHQAYEKFSDFYIKLGMPKEALETVKTGLIYSPNSRGLKKRLAKLTTVK